MSEINKYYISERFFTPEEIKVFKEKHGYNIKEIYYSSFEGEIDFSDKDEKEFLMENGFPRILARFFA